MYNLFVISNNSTVAALGRRNLQKWRRFLTCAFQNESDRFGLNMVFLMMFPVLVQAYLFWFLRY